MNDRDIYVIGTTEPIDGVFAPVQLQNGPCGSNPTWRFALKADAARLHVTIAPGESPAGVSLHLYNSASEVVAQYDEHDIDPETGLWTEEVVGTSQIIAVLCGPAGADPGSPPLKVVEYSAASPGGALYSTIGTPNFQPIADFYATDSSQNAKIWKAGRSVGKLTFFRGGAQYACSGFLVSKTLFLTNQHCIRSAGDCKSAYVQFGYQDGKTGVPATPVQQTRCKGVRTVNADLDFALIELYGNLDQWGVVTFSTTPVQPGQKLFVVQHPAGEMKQAVLVDCAVDRVNMEARKPGDKTDFSHSCDTKNGSSGSPVFNLDGQVVGLHHWGTTPDVNLNRAVTIGRISALITLN